MNYFKYSVRKMKKILISLHIVFFSVLTFSQSSNYTILISFDAFRWDYDSRVNTPNLDFVTENGVKALSLQPCFPSKTFPNHLSIITGMYPENHGIISNSIYDTFKRESYGLSKEEAIQNPKWYLGEAFWTTAERQGITTASYFWPGSELTDSLRRPTYFHEYDHNRPYDERVNGVLEWLQLPHKKRPHFITLYFDATDSYGHKYGAESPETDSSIAMLDGYLGMLLDGLREINLLDSTNIIVVSDHGMANTPKERKINIEAMLDGIPCYISFGGPILTINPKKGNVDEVYDLLKQKEDHFHVYKRDGVPEYWHYKNHPYLTPLLVVAENGWEVYSQYGFESDNEDYGSGNHGWDNYWLDMHGVFYAMGPNFKKGYKTGTIKNIDIYPMLCKIFDILPRQNIDGKFERIESIIK